MVARLFCVALIYFSYLSAEASDLPSVTFSGHAAQVRALAFSPDGSVLASGGIDDNAIFLWDVANGKVLQKLEGHRAAITALVFSTDGWLASASEDETIKIWDPETGELLRQLLGHHGPVLSIDVSPDGMLLVSASGDQSVRLWDVDAGRELTSWDSFSSAVFSVAFAPNGMWVATGDGNALVQVWDVATQEELGRYVGHEDSVWTISFSPDGKALASGSWDGSVRLWPVAADGSQAGEARILAELETWVLSVAFSPNGKVLAAGLLDWEKNSTLRLWDVETGALLHSLDHRSRYALAFSPDQIHLAAAGVSDGSIRVWRASAIQPQLVSPPDNATLENAEDIELDWEGDPGVLYYKVQIADDPNFDHILNEQKTIADEALLSLGQEDANENSVYWWRVQSGGFGVLSDWSVPRTFRTERTEGCRLQLLPSSLTLERGEIADLLIRVVGVSDLAGIQTTLNFDPNVLVVTRISEQGKLFDEDAQTIAASIKQELGIVRNIVASHKGSGGFSGTGDVAKLTIRSLNTGQTTVTFSDVLLVDSSQEPIQCKIESATITVQEPVTPWDVNRDGQVNVLDFVVIGQVFGQPVVGTPDVNPDVNRDGMVDVLDFALVAQHFGETLAAPSLNIMQQQILRQFADQLRRSITDRELLEQILTLLQPHLTSQNALGQNYPNPFNPETWIPFELAEDTHVTLKIYDTRGKLVRVLVPGFLRAGSYLPQNEAIYWDGSNGAGESVSSGVYFYTILTENFTQTRKMTVVR